jgi:hypothetical protein
LEGLLEPGTVTFLGEHTCKTLAPKPGGSWAFWKPSKDIIPEARIWRTTPVLENYGVNNRKTEA